MAANFGKFFGLKTKKKAPKVQTQDDGSDDDDGYQDPSVSCPTEPPGMVRGVMPNYPPPRPNSPKVGTKLPQQQAKKRDDYQDPWDSKEPFQKENTTQNDIRTDYADPFDAKFAGQQTKQNDELDADEEYSEPYEPVIRTHANKGPTDTYDDPWDMRKNNVLQDDVSNIDNNKSQTLNVAKQGPQDNYSDPWDSKLSKNPKNSVEYDDTYADPYDKKTVTTKVPKVPVTMKDDDDDEIYDVPEDEIAAAIMPKNTPKSKPSSIPSSISQKQQPSAPAPQSQGDYDAPWEWKVKNAEVEFDKHVSLQDLSPPVAAPRKKSSPNVIIGVTASNHQYVNPVPKPKRSSIKQENFNKEYEIDPTIPLDNQAWFHGRIRRGEAEALLKNQPDCSYLIRNSESSKIDYSLSLRNIGATMHAKISCRDGKYILGVNSRPYDTIPEMVHYYSQNKLNIRGYENVKLLYPVLQEAMYFTVEPGS